MDQVEDPVSSDLQGQKHDSHIDNIDVGSALGKKVEKLAKAGTDDDESMEQSDSKCFFFGLFDY